MASKLERPVDPRHYEIKKHIAELYCAHNGGLTVPWSGRTAKALALLLQSCGSWPLERLLACVDNRFDSEDVNLAADPLEWICGRERLVNYAGGPLNRFGRPIKVLGSDVRAVKGYEAWGDRVDREAREYLERVRRVN